MKRTVARLLVAVLTIGPALPAAHASDDRKEARHSGTVVRVDLRGRWLKVEEVGPWRGPGTPPIERLIVLTSETTARLIRPTRPHSGNMPRTMPLDPLELWPGDFVTVVIRPAAGASVAVSINVVRP
ncbi:MAG: hypothetical protein ACREJG_08155 [Candidatus Rokuibacteriota bacterium]